MYNFTYEEACLVCDALKGVWRALEDRDVSPMGLAFREVEAAIAQDQLDLKWRVDAATLIQKLMMLDVEQTRALVDAVRRFWERLDLPTDERLRNAGLL